MADTGEGPPKRRFAPVPIETTYESVRRPARTQPGGYMPEITPEPSPREMSPLLHPLQQAAPEPPKRRFAPQLIETSRRVRRVGDTGPATKPADKTDITPYTNHIYVQRTKSRRRPHVEHANSRVYHKGARRESEDENGGDYVLEWAAKEAERQMHEAALAAFPNSRAREGGAAHFYFRESSGDDTTTDASTSPAALGQPHGIHGPRHIPGGRQPRVIRRKSSDLGYWHKHMQEHAAKAAEARGETGHEDVPAASTGLAQTSKPMPIDEDVEMDDDALDAMELETPPEALWTTDKKTSKGPIGETYMPLVSSSSTGNKESRLDDVASGPTQPAAKPIGESHMPLMPPTSGAGRGKMPVASSAQIPPETGFRNFGSPFGRPFGAAGAAAAVPATREEALRRMRKAAASPPMLGKDLTFRRCPSPKLTKMEPDHPFYEFEPPEEAHRDVTEEGGLWRGYCFRRSRDEENLVPAELHGPKMLATPHPPSTPGDPFSAAFGRGSVTDEPENPFLTPASSTAEHRVRNGEAKGLHMLHGVDEKLRREKIILEREDKIATEFDDAFVTQVYNYLSLGYPATARSFDPELAKISRMSVEDLERDDARQMAAGHITEPNDGIPPDHRCPRWRALRKYIREWARQHPDLDSLEPFAWGMRERRGSWAI